jgi:hypothetical protein
MKGDRTKQLAYSVWPCQVYIPIIKTSIDELTGHGIESRLTLNCSMIHVGQNVLWVDTHVGFYIVTRDVTAFHDTDTTLSGDDKVISSHACGYRLIVIYDVHGLTRPH